MRYTIAVNGLSGVFDLGLRLFRNNARAALLVGLLLSLPGLLATGLELVDSDLLGGTVLLGGDTLDDAMAPSPPGTPELPDVPGDMPTPPTLTLKSFLSIAITLVQAFLLFPVSSGALVLLYTADLFGESMTWRDAVRQAWQRKAALCTAMALSTLYIILGMLLIVLGVYFALRFTLIYQAVILEKADPRTALRRSGVLMKSHYMTALALVLLMWGLSIGVVIGVSTTASPLVAGLVQWVAEAGAMCAVTACYTALYFSARHKHEGFELRQASPPSA